ncbi:MAG: damage-inducible mutagenesis protein [Acetobacteraceae bacterium]|nr:damage-inducible mutagenesis protein [Acetobacteraceae bacterium]
MQHAQTPQLAQLRATITRLERSHTPANAPAPLPFGLPPIDDALPGGGLPLGALHEVAGQAADLEHGAAAALFAAGILARIGGPVLWVLEHHDLFAPGLAAAGLHPDRVVYAEAGRKDALLVMEEGLRQRGLAGVVAEVSGRVTLTASRRLQLAAEATGVTALLLRRPKSGGTELAGAVAAVTRWRIGTLPSPPPIPHAPDVPGLGWPRWQLDLLRCRGGRTGSWITEACDATGHLRLVAPLADRPAAAHPRHRRTAA